MERYVWERSTQDDEQITDILRDTAPGYHFARTEKKLALYFIRMT